MMIYLWTAVAWLSVALSIAMIVQLRRATARLKTASAELDVARSNYDTARENLQPDEIVMPQMEVDAEGRIVKIDIDLGTIEAGASKSMALPIIKGLGQQVLALKSAEGVEQNYLFDFETGEVIPIGDIEPVVTSPVPEVFRDWRDAETDD